VKIGVPPTTTNINNKEKRTYSCPSCKYQGKDSTRKFDINNIYDHCKNGTIPVICSNCNMSGKLDIKDLLVKCVVCGSYESELATCVCCDKNICEDCKASGMKQPFKT
jgi:hypothetical protein